MNNSPLKKSSFQRRVLINRTKPYGGTEGRFYFCSQTLLWKKAQRIFPIGWHGHNSILTSMVWFCEFFLSWSLRTKLTDWDWCTGRGLPDVCFGNLNCKAEDIVLQFCIQPWDGHEDIAFQVEEKTNKQTNKTGHRQCSSEWSEKATGETG